MMTQVAIQLFALREQMKEDLPGTLKKVAEAGYRQIEIAGRFPGLSAKETKELTESFGLTIVGAHIGSVDRESIEAELDFHREMGVKFVVCGNDFFAYGVPSDVLNRCDDYNYAGKLARERGLFLCYHNHFQEFQNLCRMPAIEWILENTDPELLSLELDVYWAARTGIDVVDFVRRYADRIAILHVKDFPADAPQKLNMFDGVLLPYQKLTPETFDYVTDKALFTELGDGIIPLAELIGLGKAAGIPWTIIDQDSTMIDPFASIRKNKAFLEQFGEMSF